MFPRRKQTSRWLEIALKLSGIFGASPYYVFKHNKMIVWKKFTIFQFLFYFPVLVHSILDLIGPKDYPTSVLLLYVIFKCGVSMLLLEIFFDIFFCSLKQWRVYVKRLDNLRRNLKRSSGYRTAQFLIVGYFHTFLCFVRFSLSLKVEDFCKILLLQYIQHYYFLCHNINVIVKKLFEDLRCDLRCLVKHFSDKTDVQVYYDTCTVRNIGRRYKKLSDLVGMYNCLLGTKGIYIFVIQFFNDMMIYQQLFSGNGAVSLIPVATAIIHLIYTTIIVTECDEIVKTSNEIISECYKFREKYQSKGIFKRELDNLIKLLKYVQPVFTCRGLFEINTKSMMTFYSTEITYLIVIIQLDNQPVDDADASNETKDFIFPSKLELGV